MSVNESIYGAKAEWRTDNFEVNNDDNMNHYSANFGNNNGQVLYAIRNNKLKVNTPWDKSISYAAMDGGSVFSKVTFCASNGTTAPNVLTSESNSLTEFNIGITNRNPSGTKQYNILKDKSYYTTMFWASNSTATDGTSTDREFCPTTSISFRNMVLVPFVLATASNVPPIADNDKICVTLKEYINTYKLTHPYIVRVVVAFYGKTFANITRTSIAKGIPTIAILNQLPNLGNKLNEINESTPDVMPFYTYTMCRGFIGGGSGLRNVARGMNLFGECQTDSDVDVWGYSSNAYLDTDTGSNHYMSAWLNYNKYVHVKNESYPKKIFSYIPYYDNFYEDVMTQTAYFGLFFTPDLNVAENGELNDNEMYCGVIDGSGVTHGQYYHGSQNELLKQFSEWGNTNDTPYKPGGKVDDNTHSKNSGFNALASMPQGFTTHYVLNNITNITTLKNEFYSVLPTVTMGDIRETMAKTFYTNNPLDTIVSLKFFPCNVPHSESTDSIKLGAWTSTVQAPKMANSLTHYNIGECSFLPFATYKYFGKLEPTFLDYEPYTSAELYVPYCGTLKIEPSLFMNKYLKVEMSIDFYTGDCTAFVFTSDDKSNFLCVATMNGNCAIDLPIGGIEKATLDSATYSANLQAKQAQINETATIVKEGINTFNSIATTAKIPSANSVIGSIQSVTSSVQNVANSVIERKQKEYNLTHINIPYKIIGSQSSAINYLNEQFCRLIIYMPVLDSDFDSEIYGKTIGYACCITDKLSAFSGLAVCNSVDCKTGYTGEPTATENEKILIENLLKGGVYL